jgi:hypothetical protein
MTYIKMDIKEIGCENVGWIHLLQNRHQLQAAVNTEMNLCSIKCLEYLHAASSN